MNEHYEKWDQMAPRGMLLIGFGAALVAHASNLKANKKGFIGWFFFGTLGLIALNAGVALFGEAVKSRTLYELDVQKLREG